MKLDYEQYKLVREALHERKVFLHTAPYLSVMQPIMLPVYKWVHHPSFPREVGSFPPLARTERSGLSGASERYHKRRLLSTPTLFVIPSCFVYHLRVEMSYAFWSNFLDAAPPLLA